MLRVAQTVERKMIMYAKHKLKIIRFADNDVFGGILVLSGDENGDGTGPASINPGLSDS